MSGSAVRRGSQRARAEWANFMQWQGRSAQVRQQQRKKIPRNLKVEIPESTEFYDTPNLKIALGMVAVTILAKLTMMYDESKEEERTERRAKEQVESQAGAPQIVSRELWDHLQQLRPRTPFESGIARDNARIRTGDPLSLEDIKDWAVDVLTEALARKEDSLRPRG
ncbi:unnamed protein product [Calypogeia fissa]